jgi:hypothetical protein
MALYNFKASCSGTMNFSQNNMVIPNVAVTFSENMTFGEFPRNINDLLLFLIAYNFDVRGTFQVTTGLSIFSLTSNVGVFYPFSILDNVKNSFIYFVLDPNTAAKVSEDGGIKIYSINNTTNSFFVSFQVTLDIYWKCENENLDSNICTIFVCSCLKDNSDTCTRCRQNFLDYCFSQPIIYTTPNIFHSEFCKDFLKNFYNNLGPDSVIEQKLIEVCSNIAGTDYESIGQFINNNRNTDFLKICACHFNNSFYEKVESEAEKIYPGISNLGLLNHCFVKECVNSPYPSILIFNSECKGAECVSIVNFKDKNTNINVKIEQNTDCQRKINPQPPPPYYPYYPYYPYPPSPPSPPGPPEPPKKINVTLIVIGSIVLITIVVAVFIIAKRKKSKQKMSKTVPFSKQHPSTKQEAIKLQPLKKK